MPRCLFNILHISDLHFIAYLQNSTDAVSSIVGAKPHHYSHVQNLCIQVEGIKKIDHVVVTGDLTTTARADAFEEVNNFLRGAKYVSKNNPIGLNRGTDVFVVPGNHDTWHRRIDWSIKNLLSKIWGGGWDFREKEWNRYFFEQYPYIHPFPDEKNPKIIFIGIDTNQVDTPHVTDISRGRVGSRQLGDLVANVKDKWPGALKIVLMHHHLALPKDFPGDKYTKLIDDTETHRAFFDAEIDLVLCGHQHKHFSMSLSDTSSPYRKIFLSCAGSATQINEEENSFKLYEFFDDHIKIRTWTKSRENLFFNECSPNTPNTIHTIEYPNGIPLNLKSLSP